VSPAIRNSGAKVVVLQPVDVEGANPNANRVPGIENRDPAADCPGAEQRSNEAL
jgi:hypothetical protein